MLNFNLKYSVSILISFSFLFCSGEEQNIIDSLENLLGTMSDTGKVNLLNRLSENYRAINFAKAMEKATQAKELAEKNGFKKGSAKSSSQAGLAYYFQGNYDNALQSYFEAMKIYETIGEKGGIAITLNDIGNVYRKNGDSKNALKSFLRAEKIFSENNDKRGVAICYDNTGVVYSEMKEHDLALEYFLKSLAIDREMDFKPDIPYSLMNAAGIYSIKGQYEKAEEFYAESLQIREELKDKSGIAITLNDMGELNLMRKDFRKAVEYFEHALKIALEIKFKDLTRHIYQMLSETFAMQNKFDVAYRYAILSTALKDEIFNEQKSKQIAEMQTKYDTEKKEKEIEIQNLKIHDQQMKLSQRNIFILILFAGLIMITAIAFLIYRQEKLKQKQITDKALMEQQELRIRAIIEGEEKERRRLAQELHDGLGQMLSTVKLNISGLEGNVINQKEKQLNASLSLLDESCHELRNISHNLMPSALIKLGLIPALKEFTDKINHSGDLKIHLQTHGIQDRLNSSVETGLYRIIQELLNNIIKYAKAKNVTIQLIKDENQLTTMVEDDGIGFDLKSIEHSDGIGWKNIKSRVQFLNGNFDIDSHPNRGTTVTIDIPVAPPIKHGLAQKPTGPLSPIREEEKI